MTDSGPIRLTFPSGWRWRLRWVPLMRGDDGLTYRERRATARRYAETVARMPTRDEIDGLRRRLAQIPPTTRARPQEDE